MTTFTGVFSGHPFDLNLNVTDNNDGNPGTDQSTVSWSLQIVKTGSFTPYNNSTEIAYVTIDGNNYSGGYTYNFNGSIGQTITILSGTTTVTHNPDGTYNLNVAASTTAGSTLGSASTSGSMALATIARASIPTFQNSVPATITSSDAGLTITIQTNRADPSFTHTIAYSIGTASGTIATGVGASTTWTIPLSLLSQIPNSNSGLITITTTTYNASSVQVASPTTVTLTMTCPVTVLPSFTSITNSEATSGVAAAVGAYVQSITTLALAIAGAAGIYGSTITSYSIAVAGQTISASSGTTTAINASGTVGIVGTVTDSRGNSYSHTTNVTVLAYAAPSLAGGTFTVQRATSGGTVSPSGTYLREDFNASVSSLIPVSTQKNTLTYKIYTQVHGVGPYVLQKTVALSAGTITFNSYDIVGTYLLTSAYDVQITITDLFNTVTFSLGIGTAAVFMHWGTSTQGLGVGKFWQQGTVDAVGQMYQNNNTPVVDTSYAAPAATIAAGTDNVDYITALGLAPTRLGARNRSRIINGNFRTNQRGYASAASIPLGTYSFDRWKASGRTNLVTNPAARSATTGWATQGTGTLSQITGQTITGLSGVTTAARTTLTASTVMGIYWQGDITSPYTLVTAGQIYEFSIWVRSSVSITVSLNLEYANSGGTTVGSNPQLVSVALTANTWTRLSGNYITPATAVRVGVYVLSATTGVSSNTFDGTGLLIESGQTLLPYFDGTFTGCSWASTANASISYVGAAAPVVPTLTYTSAPQGQTVTINAKATISQTVEQANLASGSYVLSWTGTATARIYDKGLAVASLSAFAVSPITFTADGLDDVTVEFSTPTGVAATLGQVQLESGSAATPFEVIPITEELFLCQRYFYELVFPIFSGAINSRVGGAGVQVSTTSGEWSFPYPVPMRILPSIFWNGISWTDGYSFNAVISSVLLYESSWYPNGIAIQLITVFTSNGAALRVGFVEIPTTGGYIALNSEF